MRTAYLDINNKKYLTCFSTRVAFYCEEKFGSVTDAINTINSEAEKGKIKHSFYLLYEMLKAGAAYAKLEGIENPELMNFDDFIDSVSVADYKDMFSTVFKTINNGNIRNVEVEPEKKETEPVLD